jgi:hypothetical protein
VRNYVLSAISEPLGNSDETVNHVVRIKVVPGDDSQLKREDVGAELETLLVEFGEAGAVALFKRCAAFAFLERLHPLGFGDVSYRFG